MGKLILLSVVVATIAIPIWAAGTGSPVRAFRRMLTGVLLFYSIYLIAIMYVLPRIG